MKWLIEAALQAQKQFPKPATFIRDSKRIATYNKYGFRINVKTFPSINKAKNWSRLYGEGKLRNGIIR